jgi:uncharacterized membrane protein YciS (DUF1049 family)
MQRGAPPSTSKRGQQPVTYDQSWRPVGQDRSLLLQFRPARIHLPQATALERILMAEQNLSNHNKFFPPFHFFVIPMMLVNVVQSILAWRHSEYSIGGLLGVLVALGLLVGFTCSRMMALKVQDRVIRLEERLRLEKLLPADLQARIPEFTTGQLIALRFASNSELPELARKVLDEHIKERKAIKQMIKVWRPDYLRA